MSDLIKIGFGFLSGLLLQWLFERDREKRNEYRRVLEDYLKAVAKPEIEEDDYLRFAALQRVGAWRLSLTQLKTLAEEVRGRGLKDPYEAWSAGFGNHPDFPKGFLMWAQEKNVNLSDFDSAMLAIAAEADAANLPKPPQKFAGVILLP